MSLNMTESNILNSFQTLKQYKELGTVDELSKKVGEEDILKFYYCESTDDYYVGRRTGTLYYATVDPEMFELTFFMSRYLPWGEGEYPSEPREISFSKWLRGWVLKNQ